MKGLATLSMMRLLISTASLFSVATAFSASSPPSSAVGTSRSMGVGGGGSLLEDLSRTPLSRASDGASVTLPSLWRKDTILGLGDEIAVCAFLRHYGWFLCWEHASQLRDRVLLPANNKNSKTRQNAKLFFVGVGTSDAALEFATQLEIDPALCFGDEGGVAGETLGLDKGLGTMWNPPAVNQMMSRNDKEALEDLGKAYKAAVDNVGFQNLAPKDARDTLRQGGTFVFKGSEPLFAHYDSKVGDNADIDAILSAIQQ